MANRYGSGIFSALMLTLTLSAQAEPLESVDQLLDRAARALQEQNYQGRFTYEFGNTMETLEIVHLVRDGVEYERISHLNGLPREFLRSGRQQDCVSTGSLLLRGGLIASAGRDVSLAQNYHFYLRGRERIAGRDAAVVQAVPKDEYRYGMTLAVDRISGLPLMSLTTLANQGAIERFQFVQLAVGNEVTDDRLAPVADRYAHLDGSKSPCGAIAADEDAAAPGSTGSDAAETAPRRRTSLEAGWLPPGFVLSQISTESGRDLLTYTDGIASFTVFFSPLTSPDAFKQGIARRGATTALMSILADATAGYFSVVLVGEVPVATAQQVVASITFGRTLPLQP